MSNERRLIAVLSMSALICACGAQQTDTSEPSEPAPMPVEETVFGDMVESMDKARDVDATVLEHKREVDQALEQAEGQ